MNGILIFIAGAFFGALVVCFSVCAAIAVSGGLKQKPQQAVHSSHEEKDSGEEELTEEQEKMKRQFENFLNYDGTTEGQVELGGE